MPIHWDLTQLNVIITRPGRRHSRDLRWIPTCAGMPATPGAPVFVNDGNTQNGNGKNCRRGANPLVNRFLHWSNPGAFSLATLLCNLLMLSLAGFCGKRVQRSWSGGLPAREAVI